MQAQPVAGSVESVSVSGDVGLIEIVPSRQVRVVQDLRAPEGAVEREEQLVDGHLQITTRCKSPVFCSVDTRIMVPEGVPVDVELARGEIWATGVGNLDVELGSGTLDLEVIGPLRARVGQGLARVESASDQLIRLAVGQGDIEMIVPRSPWQVDVQARESHMLGVDRRRQARGSLELVAPAGRVEVRAVSVLPDSGSPRTP